MALSAAFAPIDVFVWRFATFSRGLMHLYDTSRSFRGNIGLSALLRRFCAIRRLCSYFRDSAPGPLVLHAPCGAEPKEPRSQRNRRPYRPAASRKHYPLSSTLDPLPYCGIGAGVSVNGFGGAGAFGAVKPGIFGA